MNNTRMREYFSLKKWTVFSTCVYYGTGILGLLLFQALLDDIFSRQSLLLVYFNLSYCWLFLALASFIYLVNHVKETKWYSVAPLGVNAVTIFMAYTMSIYEWPSRLELAIKWRGLVHVAQQVEKGAITGAGKRPVPRAYRYLTRVDGIEQGIDIERQGKDVGIFFPLNSGFWGDLQGVIYFSDDRMAQKQIFSSPTKGQFPVGEKISPHWYFGGYSADD